MLRRRLKINRTTWGLAFPCRRPPHQPPHFLIRSQSATEHYYCNISIYYCTVKHAGLPFFEIKWTFVQATACLLKTDRSSFFSCVRGACALTGGYTSGRLQGHDGLQVDSLVSAPYSWPNWDEGIAGRWGGREAEGQHGWQTMQDRDLDQASGRTELQS